MARYIDADNLKLNFASYLQRGKLEKDEAVYRGEFYNWRIDGTEIKEAINREPTADVRENVRGEWVRNDNGTYSCNRCRSWIPQEQKCYANYCLFCGADMRGGKEGD